MTGRTWTSPDRGWRVEEYWHHGRVVRRLFKRAVAQAERLAGDGQLRAVLDELGGLSLTASAGN